MIKKILLGTSISLVFFGSAIAGTTLNDELYIKYQKETLFTEWTISGIYSKKPIENFNPKTEELLIIKGDTKKPLFAEKFLMENQNLKCPASSTDEYSPCVSEFTKEIYPDGNKHIVYDDKKINKIYNQTKTELKINEFKEARKLYSFLLDEIDLSWLRIVEASMKDWEKYDQKRKTIKQEITLIDESGLFKKDNLKNFPQLFSFTRKAPEVKKPKLFQDESFLNKLNPDNLFQLYGHLTELKRAIKTVKTVEKVNILNNKNNLQLDFFNVKVNYPFNKINGWNIMVEGPESVDLVSSDKYIPIKLTILSKDVAGVVPELSMKDENVDVELKINGDLFFKNLSKEDVKITKIETVFNDEQNIFDELIKIPPTKTYGIDAFDKELFPQKVFFQEKSTTAAVKKTKIKISLTYEINGKEMVIFEEASDNLASLIRES